MNPNKQQPPENERTAQSRATMSPKEQNGVKALNLLAWEAQRAKYPEIPEAWLVKPKYSDKTANKLTQSILAWIRLHGYQAERISVSGRTLDHRQTVSDCLGNRRVIGSLQWIPGTMTRGSADISATIAGRSVKIEVKIGRDRQSKHQRIYQLSVEQAGGVYYIATDFQSFFEWFTDYLRDFSNRDNPYIPETRGEYFGENQPFQ